MIIGNMDMQNIKKCNEELDKILKEKPFQSFQSEIEKIGRDIRERQDNAMAMEFTRVICDLLKENGVSVHRTEYRKMENTSENTIKERYGVIFDSMDFSEHDKKFKDEINKLKCELKHKEEIIKQIEELKAENAELHCEMQSMGMVCGEMPEEPIDVASMLINGTFATGGVISDGKAIEEYSEKIFNVSELRQIAGYLLVYCNANKGENK